MKSRHLERTDAGYKVYLYIFYALWFHHGCISVFGVYVTMQEWLANGTYVMGEAIHNTTIPFENFARVSTWIFFSTIIDGIVFLELDGEELQETKLLSCRMALLQLMLLGFSIITLYGANMC